MPTARRRRGTSCSAKRYFWPSKRARPARAWGFSGTSGAQREACSSRSWMLGSSGSAVPNLKAWKKASSSSSAACPVTSSAGSRASATTRAVAASTTNSRFCWRLDGSPPRISSRESRSEDERAKVSVHAGQRVLRKTQREDASAGERHQLREMRQHRRDLTAVGLFHVLPDVLDREHRWDVVDHQSDPRHVQLASHFDGDAGAHIVLLVGTEHDYQRVRDG